MATYTPEELTEGWEFKILRSATSGFKDAGFLRRSLEEEAPAGWTLIEKFDNGMPIAIPDGLPGSAVPVTVTVAELVTVSVTAGLVRVSTGGAASSSTLPVAWL